MGKRKNSFLLRSKVCSPVWFQFRLLEKSRQLQLQKNIHIIIKQLRKYYRLRWTGETRISSLQRWGDRCLRQSLCWTSCLFGDRQLLVYDKRYIQVGKARENMRLPFTTNCWSSNHVAFEYSRLFHYCLKWMTKMDIYPYNRSNDNYVVIQCFNFTVTYHLLFLLFIDL